MFDPLQFTLIRGPKNFPGGSDASAYNAGDPDLTPGLGRCSGEGNGNPTPVLLTGKSHGRGSVVGYSPWGLKETRLRDFTTKVPGYYETLLFTRSGFITSHIWNWVLFLLWLHAFIISVIPSPLISRSILGICQPWEILFLYTIFCHGMLLMGFSKQEYWRDSHSLLQGLRFVKTLHHDPSILGGPTSMAYSYIELDKTLGHVISLVSFLWLWFSFCLPSDG